MDSFYRLISSIDTPNVDLLAVTSSQYEVVRKCMTLKAKGQFQNNQLLHRKKEAVEYLTAICCNNTSMILGSAWINF